MLPVESPFKIYTGRDGKPLNNGYIYFGAVSQNPITQPVTVFWDAAGTQPAAQPLRTENGYIVRTAGGMPANVFFSGSYSELVQDSKKRQVFYARTSDEFSIAAAVLSFIASIAASAGSSLMGFIQAGLGAIAGTVQGELRARAVTPQQFGAVGDGVADDAIALAAMFATGKPWYIPYTVGGYKTSTTQIVNADGICDGFFIPTAAIGAASLDVDRFVFIVASGGYPVKRVIRGIKIQGSVALRTALVKGIRNDCENSTLEYCYVSQLDYGIVPRTYSITLRKCNAEQCNTNLSAYAPGAGKEINTLTIDGGNYDSGVTFSANIGDLRWIGALPAGTSHGVDINIINGANFDGGEVKIDNCSVVNVTGIYNETSPTTGSLVRLGGSGDGNLRNVYIGRNFFKNAKYAVRCDSAVQNLSVRDNFLTQITVSEVWLTSDIYGIDYKPGVQVASFANGQAVRITFRSLAIGAVAFDNFTLENDGLVRGCQDSVSTPGKWYPGGQKRNAGNRTINVSSGACAFYTAPALTKAGIVAGSTFTFTTPADSYAFNGGDRIVTAPVGALYVRSVDYEAGTMVMDGGTTPAGAATVSQTAVTTAAAA